MKLEETENLKLQYVDRIETNTIDINNIQGSDLDLSEKITEILNIYGKIQISMVNHLSKNGVIICKVTDTALLNVNKSNRITRTNHKSTKNQINHFTNT